MNIEIIETEDKIGQKGPYLRVETNKGWMSAFEEEVINLIKINKGNIISVETTTNGPYINITKFLGVVEAKPSNPITNNPTDSSPPIRSLTNEEINFVRKLKKASNIFEDWK